MGAKPAWIPRLCRGVHPRCTQSPKNVTYHEIPRSLVRLFPVNNNLIIERKMGGVDCPAVIIYDDDMFQKMTQSFYGLIPCTMSAFVFNDREVYNAKDLKEKYPIFFHKCMTNLKTVVTKRSIPMLKKHLQANYLELKYHMLKHSFRLTHPNYL